MNDLFQAKYIFPDYGKANEKINQHEIVSQSGTTL